jgi:hypothetical protein
MPYAAAAPQNLIPVLKGAQAPLPTPEPSYHSHTSLISCDGRPTIIAAFKGVEDGNLATNLPLSNDTTTVTGAYPSTPFFLEVLRVISQADRQITHNETEHIVLCRSSDIRI